MLHITTKLIKHCDNSGNVTLDNISLGIFTLGIFILCNIYGTFPLDSAVHLCSITSKFGTN